MGLNGGALGRVNLFPKEGAQMHARSQAPQTDAREARGVISDFRFVIAERLEAANQTLAARWLEELKKVVAVPPGDIFPGEQLLGHVPALIRELAAFVRAPREEDIAANGMVTKRAIELGQLRHAQRASVHQVVREYQALRAVVVDFAEQEAERLNLTPGPAELFEFTNTLDAAIDVLLRTTLDTFIAEYTETINQDTARLESFYQTVSHELRQPLGTLQFGLKVLRTEEAWSDRAKRDRFIATCERNVAQIGDTLGKLVGLLRTPEDSDNALIQQVNLTGLVNAVARQLHEMAETRGVEVRVAPSLPTVTADLARLELTLVNLISNAIKYSDPAKETRFVEIDAAPADRPDVHAILVRDNGIGVAEPELRSIFGRFYRGHADRDGELGNTGLGLGLSIVADCVNVLSGDIRVESVLGEGTTFVLELPITSTR